MKKISVSTLKGMIDREEDFHLVNVLPHESFEQKHIPGSVNIPFEDEAFGQRMRSLVDDPNAKVVVYCASTQCDASAKAARQLEEQGFRNVQCFEGGVKEWEEASLPLEGVAVS